MDRRALAARLAAMRAQVRPDDPDSIQLRRRRAPSTIRAMPLRTVRSTCPHDCPDACGLLVETDGERVVSVRGDPEHGYSRGALCPKVNGYERTVHAPGRLLVPLLREGLKGEGRFRPTTWDEALSRIASRWKAIVAEHGGEAILPYSYAGTMGLVQRNAGHAFFHRLGASRLDRTICSPAKDAGWKAVMGETPGPHPDEVLRSDLVGMRLAMNPADAAGRGLRDGQRVFAWNELGEVAFDLEVAGGPTFYDNRVDVRAAA